MKKKNYLSRRKFLRLGVASAAGVVAAACQPKTVIIEREVPVTRVVEKEATRIVEKEVPVTRVVEKEVPVTRIVEKEVTRIVEKEVPVTRIVEKEVTRIVEKEVPVTCSIEPPEPPYVEVSVKSANLRAGPGISCHLVSSASQGETLPLLARAVNADGEIWFQVQYNDKSSFVSAPLVRANRSLEEIPMVEVPPCPTIEPSSPLPLRLDDLYKDEPTTRPYAWERAVVTIEDDGSIKMVGSPPGSLWHIGGLAFPHAIDLGPYQTLAVRVLDRKANSLGLRLYYEGGGYDEVWSDHIDPVACVPSRTVGEQWVRMAYNLDHPELSRKSYHKVLGISFNKYHHEPIFLSTFEVYPPGFDVNTPVPTEAS